MVNLSADTHYNYEHTKLRHEADQADKQRQHEIGQLIIQVVAGLIGLLAILGFIGAVVMLYLYCKKRINKKDK